MIEQNRKQNEELMKRIEQLESEKAASEVKMEKFMTRQEEKNQKTDDLLSFFDSIDLGFYVDTTYQYVFNRGVTNSLQLRALYPDNQQFALNAFTISVSKVPSLEGGLGNLLGFRADILLGEQADELGGEGFDSDVIDPYQAYLQILAPVGNGINIYAGRFVTLAGYEVIEAWKDPNITRSDLFGFAVPFTHTGIRANYTAGPLTFTAGLNNGWDQVQELNDSPTIESQIAYSYGGSTVSSAWLGLTGYFGKEPSGLGFGGQGWRELITAVGTITFLEKLSFIVDADFGWQQDVVFDELGSEESVSWWGIAGYIVADPHPAVRLSLRGEYFDDPDGYRTGTAQKLVEITPTLILKPFKGLIAGNKYLDNFEARAEFRWDHSDEDFFETKNDGFKKNQYGVMGQLLYWINL
ncbi:MAG TPA: outer membrane beta-barrel protein [Thermodesulfobacteriota bacterium]|nr:outer membrane beta-barrel protein [Thermodesulfobacteriota bacterium]